MCGNLVKYGSSDHVKHLIFVQCIGGSNARILLYEKKWRWEDGWKILLVCPGYIGRNGYTTGWKREGDGKTPCGNFGIMGAFGIKENPGTGLNYLRVLDEFYWCDEPGMYYNRLVSTREVPEISGEHLIEHVPQYHYGLFLDYNKEGIQGAGSAIFIHCTGQEKYTGGCVAVSERNMIFILRHICQNDRVIIAPDNCSKQ